MKRSALEAQSASLLLHSFSHCFEDVQVSTQSTHRPTIFAIFYNADKLERGRMARIFPGLWRLCPAPCLPFFLFWYFFLFSFSSRSLPPTWARPASLSVSSFSFKSWAFFFCSSS